MPDTEHHLIQHAQKGDQEAFAALVTEHQRYVYNLALRVLKNEEEALDLAQETFVRAWMALPNFRGQSQFRTWLYRIVTNLCYNRLPRLRRDLAALGVAEAADLPDDPETNPAVEAEASERRAFLHRAIDELPEGYRMLVMLRFQQGLPYEEIA